MTFMGGCELLTTEYMDGNIFLSITLLRVLFTARVQP